MKSALEIPGVTCLLASATEQISAIHPALTQTATMSDYQSAVKTALEQFERLAASAADDQPRSGPVGPAVPSVLSTSAARGGVDALLAQQECSIVAASGPAQIVIR